MLQSQDLHHQLLDTPARFEPTNFEEVLAAFTARAYLGDKLDASEVLSGMSPLTEALLESGGPVSPTGALFFAEESARSETLDPQVLSAFEQYFIGVSPSIRLGALLCEGVGAPVPHYSEIDARELENHLARMWVRSQDLGLDLANMATLAVADLDAGGDGIYTLDRALRLLLVPATPAAGEVGPVLAREHMRWCVTAYQFACR